MLHGFTYKSAHIFSQADWAFSISLVEFPSVSQVLKASATSAVRTIADVKINCFVGAEVWSEGL